MEVGASAGLAAGSYFTGVLALLVAVVALGAGAWQLRAGLIPEFSGAVARLAEATLVLGAAIGVAQLLGTFGQFRPGPVFGGLVVTGMGMGVLGLRLRTRAGAPQSDASLVPRAKRPPKSVRKEIVAVVFAAAFVSAQWAMHIAHAFGRGMTHPDTLWYHATYAAKFVESGSLTGLPDRTDVIQAYYPLNSTLVHALVDLPFRIDVLAPLVNIGWAVLALMAAWCLGRRRDLGHLAVLGTVAVLGLPMLAATQPGQASNDVAVSALLLVAIILLLEGELAPAPTAIAGIAAGLAIGTKLTVLVPVAVLTVAVAVLAVRGRRAVSAIAWCVALFGFGSYWYVRNWVEAGSPLPWFSLDLGPIEFVQRAEETGSPISSQLTNDEAWRKVYLPGLSQALGRVWPVVLALVVVSAIFVLSKRNRSSERVVGIAILGGLVAYFFTPGTGGLNFPFNLRYLTPVLFLAFALLPWALVGVAAIWRRVFCVGMLALIVIDATTRHIERIPAWPSDEVWVGLLAGAGVLAIAGVALGAGRRRHSRRAIALAGAIAVALVVLAGWPVQRHFLEHRYVAAELPFDAITNYFRNVEDRDVIVFGTVETYPLFGLDFSNRVDVGQGPSTNPDADPCRQWKDVVDGKYDYVVFTREPVIVPVNPPLEWFAEDPNARLVVDAGDDVVYRLRGPLHPAACETGSAR